MGKGFASRKEKSLASLRTQSMLLQKTRQRPCQQKANANDILLKVKSLTKCVYEVEGGRMEGLEISYIS